MYRYLAFCMDIRSEIPLPLVDFDDQAYLFPSQRPVCVKYGTFPVPDTLDYTIADISYAKVHSAIVIRVPRLADFCLDASNTVTVQPGEAAHPSVISQLMIGLVLPFLVKRQAVVTLHGSSVAIAGNAYIIIGERGSGKSTTAAALTLRNGSMLCDDIVPVSQGPNGGSPVVLPGIPFPKLLPDARRSMLGAVGEASFQFDGIDKYQALLQNSRHLAPLSMLFILSKGQEGTPVRCSRLQGQEKIARLTKHLSVLPGIESLQQAFMHSLEFFAPVPVFSIVRPQGTDTVGEVAEMITQLAMGH